ncbi:MAG TPA: hypothetical protein VGQ41_04095 [Pyrinomonadaceae bacterium]|jgi:hypothetical protein|nr:hypothetical protein [Pyrinomonadaceae bacterium]
MNIRFLTMAETEVDNAVSWHQEQTEDQSLNFLNELDRTVQTVKAYQLIAAEIEPDIRRFIFRRFPYLSSMELMRHDRGDSRGSRSP